MQELKASKETQDKVKLAKKYIQDKYQTFMKQQKILKEKWGQIYALIKQKNILEPERIGIQNQINQKLLMKKRLSRQKDRIQNYELHQLIGRGAFGDVKIAKNKSTNQVVAIKIMEKKHLINKKQISTAYIQRQLMIKNNQSRYLVNLYSTFQDKKNLYIVMEYVAGGDLLHLLIQKDVFTEQETKFYIAEIVLAVQEIHSKNYIHRDIKPDNVLITKDGHIKISDFGLSKQLQLHQIQENCPNFRRKLTKSKEQKFLYKLKYIKKRSKRKFSKVGTPDYISPEVLTSQIYDHSVDIWSIGVIMFQCLFGYPPFSDDDSQQVCHKVFPPDIEVSLEAQMLMLSLMSDRKSRISIQQIKKHPFFSGINWEKLHLYKPPMIPNITHDLDTRNFQIIEENLQKQIISQNQEKEKIDHFSDKQNIQNILQLQRSPTIKNLDKKRSTSQQIVFAGFQYKKVDLDAFHESQIKLKNLRCSHKLFKTRNNKKSFKMLKRLYTEEQSKLNLSKKSFYSTSNQKMNKNKCKFFNFYQNNEILTLKQNLNIKKLTTKNFNKKQNSFKKI